MPSLRRRTREPVTAVTETKPVASAEVKVEPQRESDSPVWKAKVQREARESAAAHADKKIPRHVLPSARN